MPIEFEDELGDALRRTADTFQPGDSRSLVEDGYAHGRRLRRRRTLMVAAGVAAFATIGVGGVVAGTLAKGDGGRNAGVASTPAHPSGKATPTATATAAKPLSGKQVVALFTSMLPKGQVTVVMGRGTEDGMPLAGVIFDAGKGPGSVQGYAQLDGQLPEGCPDPKLNPGTECRITHVHGGTLEIFKGYEYPDHRGGIKDWEATFFTAAGNEVGVSEWNSTAEKGAPRTLTDPPLDAARLAAIVTDPRWQQVIDAIPPSQKTGNRTS